LNLNEFQLSQYSWSHS